MFRSSGHLGHLRVLGANPQDGAPRVFLEDQYRIPERLIYYIIGWARMDQEWIKPPVDPVGRPPSLFIDLKTSLNPVVLSSPPPWRGLGKIDWSS